MREGTGSDASSKEIAGEGLFRALADYLRSPLLNIARGAEAGLMEDDSDSKNRLINIETLSSGALRLIDNYLLADWASRQVRLPIEPVSLSAVLYDTAHQLEALSKAYKRPLVIDCRGRGSVVMGNRQGLIAALTSLGQVFIETPLSEGSKPLLTLGSHRGRRGMIAGIFSDSLGIDAQMLRRARLLNGRTRAPLHDLTPGSAVGVFVAEALLAGMETQLKITKHDNQSGLAATFLPSTQLSLV